MRRAAKPITALLPLVAVALFWQVIVKKGTAAAFLVSRPSEIAVAAARLASGNSFWADLWASASVLLCGYFIGIALGWLLGLAAWHLGRRGGIIEGYLVALGSAPIFAFAPLLIFLLGTGAMTRVVVVAVSVLIPMALACYSAAQGTERTFGPLMEALGGSRFRQLTQIIAPGAFFEAIPSLKGLANVALVGVFLSEWISAERGLGKFVLASMSIYNVAEMWVGLFTFMLLGVAFSVAVDALEQRTTRWRRVDR